MPQTGEVLASVAEGAAEDINRAVDAASRAFEGRWSRVKPFERQNLLLTLADLVEKNFEELSQLDTLDMGAPISRTRGNRLRVLGMLRDYAGQATALHGETIENSLPGEIFSYTLKEPVGVVGAIIPWNGPLGASVWKIGPAIVTGCTVVLKPAEEAPLTSLRLAELCMEAGIPPGVVNVVPSFGETAGAALASHLGVDKVAFTGSHITGPVDRTRVGRQPETRLARAWGQYRVCRCRPRCGGAGSRDGGVCQLRTDLQRRHAAVRRRQDL
jgi:aldehyde dehydrogenase (NAD+)